MNIPHAILSFTPHSFMFLNASHPRTSCKFLREKNVEKYLIQIIISFVKKNGEQNIPSSTLSSFFQNQNSKK